MSDRDLFGNAVEPEKTKAAKAEKPKPPVLPSAPSMPDLCAKPSPFTWLKHPQDRWTTLIWNDQKPDSSL